MTEFTTPRYPPIRVNLLHAHGSPTRYLSTNHGCHCAICRAAAHEYYAKRARYCSDHREEHAASQAAYIAEHPDKTCSRCGESFPATSSFFHHETVSKDGLHALCKPCDCNYGSAYVEAHREQHDERNAAYRAAHRGEAAKRTQDWRATNPDRHAAYMVAYREAHREEAAQRGAQYYQDNRESALAKQAACDAMNPDRVKANSHAKRARKRKAPGRYTAADIVAQRTRQKGRCYWCHKKTGHQDHVDHVVPLSKGGSNGPENIVISCPACNMSKHNKLPMDFAGILF